MKKILIMLLAFVSMPVFAGLANEQEIQTRVDRIGTSILNSNKIQTRVIFTCNKKGKRNIHNINRKIKDNCIIMYDGLYLYAEDDNELAAILTWNIFYTTKFRTNFSNRYKYATSPKFYELIVDKRTVDYMVNAGYDPLALIVYLNKTCPDYKYRFFTRHNVTSERLMAIYEYIITKYPKELEKTDYYDNIYFQNFLLDSVLERKVLLEKLTRRHIGIPSDGI